MILTIIVVIGSLLAGLAIGFLILLTAPWWEPWVDPAYRWLEGWYDRHARPGRHDEDPEGP